MLVLNKLSCLSGCSPNMQWVSQILVPLNPCDLVELLFRNLYKIVTSNRFEPMTSSTKVGAYTTLSMLYYTNYFTFKHYEDKIVESYFHHLMFGDGSINPKNLSIWKLWSF